LCKLQNKTPRVGKMRLLAFSPWSDHGSKRGSAADRPDQLDRLGCSEANISCNFKKV
jgi:hypothetical protein